MSILDQIEKQPKHVREILFGLSVVTTLSLVGMLWVKTVKTDMYALLNPDAQLTEQRNLAEADQPSLFGSVFKSIGELKAQLTGAMSDDEDVLVTPTPEPSKARTFPLSQTKK